MLWALVALLGFAVLKLSFAVADLRRKLDDARQEFCAQENRMDGLWGRIRELEWRGTVAKMTEPRDAA